MKYDTDEDVDLAAIKEIPMGEVLELLGFDPPNNQGKIFSPFHEERTPSCHIYPDHWFDYSTGKGGDQIDFVTQVTGKSWRTAAQILSEGDFKGRVSPRGRTVEIPDLTERFREGSIHVASLVPAVASWVKRQWKGTIKQVDLEAAGCRVSLDGNGLWIPHYHEGRVCGVKVRAVGSGAKTSMKGSRYPHLWSPQFRNVDQPVCWLVEGESDAMALNRYFRTARFVDGVALPQAPWPHVLALPSGASTWRSEWLDELAKYERVVVCFDNDDAGHSAAMKALFLLEERGQLVEPPENDIVDSLAAGWQPTP